MKDKEINEDDFDDDSFFEEYGQELTDSFLNFCIHFSDYVTEMNEEISNKSYEHAHTFLSEYKLEAHHEDGDVFYSSEDEENLTYGIISILLRYQEKVRELDENLWERAVEYSTDYGGVGRVKFTIIKDKKEKKEKPNEDSSS